MRHASWDLPGWDELTLGKPAALEEPPGASHVERELASLTGCEAAVLGPSTLHLFLDLFALLAASGTGIFLDRGSYPVAQWAARQAGLSGAPAIFFGGRGAGSLEELLRRAPGVRPAIVTDGIFPATGTPAPIGEYANLAGQRGGLVVVDDTQALGILGAGGGGSLRHAGFRSKEVVVVSSLAKGFGVPVAMLGASAPFVEHFRRRSWTRVHCSPPSMAAIAAAASALAENRIRGDGLRARLARNVGHLRRGLAEFGLLANRSLFPVQPVRLAWGAARPFHARLLERGVRAVLHGSSAERPHISFLLTARHTTGEIASAIERVADALPAHCIEDAERSDLWRRN